jgi:uncharacterized protein (DUF1501 family)
MRESLVMNRRALLQRASALSASLGVGSLANLAAVGTAQAQSDYRALVCVFLYGGNDGCNSIVPTDSGRYGSYSSIRGALSIPRERLQGLGNTGFGLHPSLASLMPAWNEGRLAPVFNVGPLLGPMNKAQYRQALAANSPYIPDELFSHSHQQTLWETSSTRSMERTGWGGRASRAMGTANPVISFGGNARYGIFDSGGPLVLPEPGQIFGAQTLTETETRWEPYALRRAAIDQLYSQSGDVRLSQAFQAQQREALRLSSRLAPIVQRTPGSAGSNGAIDAAFARLNEGGRINTALGRQLYQIAKMIDGRATVQGNRQVFFAQLGGFDTHANQIAQDALSGDHARLLAQVGDALACFYNAMKAIGMGGAVTTFTQSDFGRTLKPNNSRGTDHAWGNHQFVLGGSVRGGRTYGTYPTLALGGPDDVGQDSWELHGRWIPTLSVDQYAATLLNWFGGGSVLDQVLPNLRNFGSARNIGFV